MDAISGLLAVAPQGGEQQNPLFGFIPFILIFVVFYFLLIAPARKKQKAHAEMVSNIKAGDKVITNGGIHGTVVAVTDVVVRLRIDDNVKIEVSRNAVAAMQARSED